MSQISTVVAKTCDGLHWPALLKGEANHTVALLRAFTTKQPVGFRRSDPYFSLVLALPVPRTRRPFASVTDHGNFLMAMV